MNQFPPGYLISKAMNGGDRRRHRVGKVPDHGSVIHRAAERTFLPDVSHGASCTQSDVPFSPARARKRRHGYDLYQPHFQVRNRHSNGIEIMRSLSVTGSGSGNRAIAPGVVANFLTGAGA